MFRIEQAVGAVDGANVEFDTTASYHAGSTKLAINGVFKEPSDDDGWVEAGGTRVTLKLPPQTGDVIQIAYRAGTP